MRRLTILRFLNESHYMFVYWIVGAFFDDIETLTLSVSLVRTFESIGSCVSFGIGAASVKPMINLIISFVMFGLTIPATTAVVFMVPERPINLGKEDASLTSGEDVESIDTETTTEKVAAETKPSPQV